MTPKTRVVISFLGTQLDAGGGEGRWQKWRPNVAMNQRNDLILDRIELFYADKYRSLADLVRTDIRDRAPHTAVNLVQMELANPWDFSEVYTRLHDWAADYPFDTEKEEYWVHITTGTHVAQICLFLLVESRQIPGLLLQTAPPKNQKRQMARGDVGACRPPRRRARRRGALPEKRHRHPQPGVQPHDCRNRAGRAQLALAHPPHWPDRRGQIDAGAADF